MTDGVEQRSAEQAAEAALEEIRSCVDGRQNFRLEAGAGAGKTESLIRTIEYLIARTGRSFRQSRQRIGCITFTNVARDEIIERVDSHDAVLVETIHGFCWAVMKRFQKPMRETLPDVDKKKFGGVDLSSKSVGYDTGFARVDEGAALLSHRHVIGVFAILMENHAKFRRLFEHRFPFLFIDEYQDTERTFMESLEDWILRDECETVVGLFGDEWQEIYRKRCGPVQVSNMVALQQCSNFRSGKRIISVLNKMRPGLQQVGAQDREPGIVHCFHTNEWDGDRRAGSHWKGDLPSEVAGKAVDEVRGELSTLGWDFDSPETRVLMLTHSNLANKQGYSEFARVFRRNGMWVRKESTYVEFLYDVLEPAMEAFAKGKFGLMFESLRFPSPPVNSRDDKTRWRGHMEELMELRSEGTIGELMRCILDAELIRVPDCVKESKRIAEVDTEEDEIEERAFDREVRFAYELMEVPYRQVVRSRKFVEDDTPFSTQHGVKGAEFENVLVVVGRGWNYYDFDVLLKYARMQEELPEKKEKIFRRSRNLFYVSCSRARRELAVLFTQQLSRESLKTVEAWFGEDVVAEVEI